MYYMNIRKAIRSDKDYIKKLHKQHAKHIGSFNLYQVWDKYLTEKTNYVYVIIDNMGFMRYGYSKKYNSYVLHEIAVDNECKQIGVGRMLYDYLPKPIMIKCNKDNEIGNKFYLKMNMTKAGVTKTKKGVEQNIWWAT